MTEPDPRLSAALSDRYRIEREIGSGGMATVYLADDLKHERKVALKVLRPELAAVLGADRFVQEIKTTANLQHPHILPLYDSGTADGLLYFVMPFIDGETLRDKLNRETQLGIEEAVRITTEIADALDYAHRNGVIHRDIKPENILLHDGRPMVADFGIALAVSAAAGGRMTETGLSLGTPYYMSPEQATAEKEPTSRSDIYSLGSMLYEMLTGNPPHVGSSVQQIIMKIVTDQARPVSELRKSVPPNVSAAVGKAIEKLPADRFESAKAFADALKNPAFATAAMPSSDTPALSSGWKFAVAAGLIIGAVAGGAGVRLWSRTVVPAGERGREQLTFNGQSQHPAISPDGNFVAYVVISCEHAQVGNCRSSLIVQEVGSTQPRVLISDALSLDAPRWSHDGLTLILGGQLDAERAGLFAVTRLSGTARLIGPSGAYDTHPAADSVLLVPVRPGGANVALVIDPGSGVVLDSLPVPFSATTNISWSPDGGHVAVITGNGLQVVDRDGHETASMKTGIRQSIRWSVDGTALLFFRVGSVREDAFVRVPVSREGTITGGAEVLIPRIPTLYRGEFDIARTTGRLVVGTGDAITDIWSFDRASGQVRAHRETRGTTWYGDPTLSLDGQTIYYYRGDALGDNVYMLNRATGIEEALTAQPLPGGSGMRLSADGRRLAYGQSTDSLAQLQYIEFPSRRVYGGPADVRPGLIVPVGQRGFIANRSADGALAMLDSLGGEWRVLSIPDSLVVANFAASPDGSAVAFVAVPGRATRRSIRSDFGVLDVLVGLASLTSDDVRIVGTLDFDEPVPGLTWDRDGTLYLGRWRTAEDVPGIWRLSPEDGGLERFVSLPVTCTPQTIQVSALGRAAVCVADDFRSDIWFIDVDGVAR